MTLPTGHPSPHLGRSTWFSLDGRWQFEALRRRPDDSVCESDKPLSHSIIVPFPVESRASGASRLARRQHFHYRRSFRVPGEFRDKELWLHLGAVDYECRVFADRMPVGSHLGGYTPMAFSLGVREPGAEVVLDLLVSETRKGSLPRGKQTHLPFRHTIFYTPQSGVWSSVWLEARGVPCVNSLQLDSMSDRSGFRVSGTVSYGGPCVVEVELSQGATKSARAVLNAVQGVFEGTLIVPQPRCWSPQDPHLYEVTCRLLVEGRQTDLLEGTAGLRTVSTENGRVFVNGQPVYLKFLLLQPYYPEGWSTPLSEEVLFRDVSLIKAMGFNGIRVHQSVADPRLLAWCDRMGLLVWDEVPSAFSFSRVDREAFESLVRELIARDRAHPSVMAWVLFNESWGISDVTSNPVTSQWVSELVATVRKLDPGRLVVDNSGFEHVDTDLLDMHHYLVEDESVDKLYRQLEHPDSIRHHFWRHLYMVLPSRMVKAPLIPGATYDGQPVVISECGGFGFGPYSRSDRSLSQSFQSLVLKLQEHPHLAGFCYTQFCDVEQECNGLCDENRQPKLEPEWIRSLLERLEP